MSAPYHPQTDGQTEWTQQTWQWYLHAYMTKDKWWVQALNTLEFTYNSSFHHAVSQPSFHVMRTYHPWIGNELQMVENYIVNQWAADYQEWLDLAQKCLTKMQESMHNQMKWTSTPSYKTGDQVWLSIKSWQPQILEVQWIGPFEIQEVLHNACCLHLLSTLHIHPVINITFLKPTVTLTPSDPHWPIISNPQDMTDC